MPSILFFPLLSLTVYVVPLWMLKFHLVMIVYLVSLTTLKVRFELDSFWWKPSKIWGFPPKSGPRTLMTIATCSSITASLSGPLNCNSTFIVAVQSDSPGDVIPPRIYIMHCDISPNSLRLFVTVTLRNPTALLHLELDTVNHLHYFAAGKRSPESFLTAVHHFPLRCNSCCTSPS